MSEQTIDRLQIEINTKSNSGADGVDRLAKSIENLLNVTGKGVDGLTGVARSIAEMKNAVSGTAAGANGLARMAQSLNAIKQLNTTGIGQSLANIGKQVRSLNGIGDSLSSIRDFNKGMTSMTKAFTKIDGIDLTGMSSKIKDLVSAVKPLTDEMIRGGTAASNYGTQLKEMAQAVKTMNGIKGSPQGLRASAGGINSKLGTGLNLAKLTGVVYSMERVATVTAGFISNINSYIENINLFTVAMGDAADEGQRFAQSLQDALGIDAGEAMRNMGFFKQLTASFGATNDQSTILAKNLAQLGYDLSSFFNLSVEESFTKLQSGIAGEIEPLRRIGIDLSEARLQQELYNLGIEESVTKLAQADKALLRYIAIMRQTTNAQGDMARTINTPANALRVLQAQLQVAGRAIGSIFIPALTAILPPAIAVVKVIGEAASAIARLFGFEMPTIDYSSLTQMPTVEISNGIDGITGSTDDYADSAKEAARATKTLISGFDELNILKAPTEDTKKDTDSGSGINTGTILGDIKLPEYDMLLGGVDTEIDEWVQKIKDAIGTASNVIKPFIPLLEGLAAAVATAFAVNQFKNFYTAFNRLPYVSDTIFAAKFGFDTFKETLKKTNGTTGKFSGLMKAANAGLKDFRTLVPTAVKAAVGVGGVVANFQAASGAVKDATLQADGWETKLLGMGATFAATETALFLFLGPWGAVAGAIAGAIGALKGFNDAQEQLQQEAFLEDFFDGTGTSIKYVSDQFKVLSDSIIRSNTPILEGRDAIDQSTESIKKSSTEIDTLIKNVVNGSKSIEETAPKIKEQLDTFCTDIKTTLEQIYNNIYRALAGSVGDALAQIGVDIPYLTSILGEVQQQTNTKIDELELKLQGLYDQLVTGNGEPTVIQQQIRDTMNELQGLVTTADPTISDFKNTISQIKIDSLNYESVDEFKAAIEQMGESASAAKDSINGVFSTTYSELEQALKDAQAVGNTEAEKVIQDALGQLQTAWDNEIGKIKTAMGDTAVTIQEDFYNKFIETANNSAPTFWQRFLNAFSGGNDTTLRAMVDNALLKPFKELDESFRDVFGEYGQDSVTGYTQGLLDEGYRAELQVKAFGSSIDQAMHDSDLDYGSPSGRMETYGEWTVEGWIIGLERKKNDAENAVSDLMEAVNKEIQRSGKDILDSADNLFSYNDFKKIGSEAAKGITDGLKEIKFPEIKVPHFEITYDTWGKDAKPWKDMGMAGKPEVDVKWYAKGGIFDSPQIIGVGERGREAVIPLEDNSPWITALAENVSAQIEAGDNGSDERLMAFINLCTDRIIDALKENGNISVQVPLDGDDIAERVLVRKGGRR